LIPKGLYKFQEETDNREITDATLEEGAEEGAVLKKPTIKD
jgi:hypothetical protein|tara:strand:- start:133 stop:255 length:123 start_codon:yes stop_codon:yes gene_type:complete